MKLIIAEKEAVGKAISDYMKSENHSIEKKSGYFIVEDEYIISWASGHILRLKSPEEYNPNLKKWEMEVLPIFFENWESVPIEKSVNAKANFQLQVLKQFLSDKRITEIYHAGDPDDEGQYLIDEILLYFNNKKPVKRILINDTTIGGIKKSFQNIKNNKDFISIGESAYARAVADYTVGINYSRFFTLKNKNIKTLSVGRVQTPTLAMIVNRDYAVENHIKEKYYELFSDVELIKSSNNNENYDLEKIKKDYNDSFHNKELAKELYEKLLFNYEKLSENYNIKMKYHVSKNNYNEIPEGKVKNRDILDNIVSLMTTTKDELKVIVSKEIKKVEAPLPFNLARLQTLCSQKFDYSPKEVLDITQNLRDKYNAITYNRSDCEYLSDDQFLEAKDTIPVVLNNLGITVPEIDYFRKSKAFNNSNITAHTGIIPTSSKFDLNNLSEKEKNIYKIIADFYIIQFLPPKLIEKTIAKMNVYPDVDLTTTSSKLLELGYTSYFRDTIIENEDEIEEENISSIDFLMEGEYKINSLSPNIEVKYTNPPKYYTEGGIIKDMCGISKYVTDESIKKTLKEKDKGKKGENGSIGTPATRSGILESLYKRGFIIKENKKVKSTKLGRELISILPPDITKADLTARWWLKQEAIKGKFMTVDEFLNSVLLDIKEILSGEYKTIDIKKEEKAKTSYGKCPICGKEIYKGEFTDKATNKKRTNYYCSGYKEGCTFKLYDEMKYFQSTLKLNDSKVKLLLKNEPVLFNTLIGKDGLEFDGKLRLKINEKDGKKYINFEYVKF